MPRRIFWTLFLIINALAWLPSSARAEFAPVATIEKGDGHLTATLFDLEGLSSVCYRLGLMLEPADMTDFTCSKQAVAQNPEHIKKKDGSDAPKGVRLKLPYLADEFDVLVRIFPEYVQGEAWILRKVPAPIVEERRKKLSAPTETIIDVAEGTDAESPPATEELAYVTAPAEVAAETEPGPETEQEPKEPAEANSESLTNLEEPAESAESEETTLSELTTLAPTSSVTPTAEMIQAAVTSLSPAGADVMGIPPAPCVEAGLAEAWPVPPDETIEEKAARYAQENVCYRVLQSAFRTEIAGLTGQNEKKSGVIETLNDDLSKREGMITTLRERLGVEHDFTSTLESWIGEPINDSVEISTPRLLLLGIGGLMGTWMVTTRLFRFWRKRRQRKEVKALRAAKEGLEQNLAATTTRRDEFEARVNELTEEKVLLEAEREELGGTVEVLTHRLQTARAIIDGPTGPQVPVVLPIELFRSRRGRISEKVLPDRLRTLMVLAFACPPKGEPIPLTLPKIIAAMQDPDFRDKVHDALLEDPDFPDTGIEIVIPEEDKVVPLRASAAQ